MRIDVRGYFREKRTVDGRGRINVGKCRCRKRLEISEIKLLLTQTDMLLKWYTRRVSSGPAVERDHIQCYVNCQKLSAKTRRVYHINNPNYQVCLAAEKYKTGEDLWTINRPSGFGCQKWLNEIALNTRFYIPDLQNYKYIADRRTHACRKTRISANHIIAKMWTLANDFYLFYTLNNNDDNNI